MTKSELIELIAAKQGHLPAKDVELAVKQILEIMSDALAQGNASKSAASAASACISGRRARGATRRPEKRSRWRASTFLISSPAKTCASASMKTTTCRRRRARWPQRPVPRSTTTDPSGRFFRRC
jgi:hypothetical protein